MNTQRIAAIFEKDYKDFMKNTTLLVTAALPIMMAVLFSQMGDGDGVGEGLTYLVYTIVGVTFSSITSGMILTMMAEENEKKTLRGLTQSPTSFLDVLIGKSLVTTIVTFVALIISLLILGYEPLLNTRAIIGILLLFVFFLFLGIGVGLFAKSVASTYVYQLPIMFLFGFSPLLLQLDFFINNEIAAKTLQYFPLIQAIEAHDTNS